MALNCPRCGVANPDVARFCRQCGLTLRRGTHGLLGAGHAPHPDPVDVPEDYQPIASAADLHFRWSSASGGAPLIGTETLSVDLFNAGYDLVDVALRIVGRDKDDKQACDLQREIELLPQGDVRSVELPSYELSAPLRAITVELIQAEFRPLSE